MYLYLVLSYTGSAPSKLIKLATGDKYTHVSISRNEDLSIMYSFGRKYIHSPIPGGFVKEDINKGLYRNKDTEILIYKLKASEQIINEFDKYVKQLREEKTHYDYKGAIGVYLNKNTFSNNGYVCSSFVYRILRDLKLIDDKSIKNKDYWNIKPEDFKNLNNIELVYEGKASKINTMTNSLVLK